MNATNVGFLFIDSQKRDLEQQMKWYSFQMYKIVTQLSKYSTIISKE